MEYSALIVAAGQGRRMNLGYNKVFYTFADGKNVLEKTMSIFEADPRCRQIVIVTQREDYVRCMRNRTQRGNVVFVEGGATRQESVFNGLMAVSEDYVLIHDGARPFLEQDCLDRICQCLSEHDACLLTVPCKDTIKLVDEDDCTVQTPKRKYVRAVQTPQVFETSLIIEAYSRLMREDSISVTDDGMVVEQMMNVPVKLYEGSYENIKITTPEDLEIAKVFLYRKK